MEAGGIEPPSRDVSRQASTCLVAHLKFALSVAERQAPDAASLVKSRQTVPNNLFNQPAFWRPVSARRQSRGERASQFRQPCATVSCQLNLRYRMINQANRCPGHATWLSVIRSMPVAPYELFKLQPTPSNKGWRVLVRLCLKTPSGFERLVFRLAASGCIDDRNNIACFAVFARQKNARSRA